MSDENRNEETEVAKGASEYWQGEREPSPPITFEELRRDLLRSHKELSAQIQLVDSNLELIGVALIVLALLVYWKVR